MGAWGIGIFEDDTAADVQDLYVRRLQNGASAEDAEQEVCSYFAAELDDADDAPVVWFALAATEWKYGRLSDAVKEQALQCIESGENLTRWYEADESLGEKRAKILDKLREQLLSPQPKAKQVRKPRTFQCPWQVGDVYAMQMQSESAETCGMSGNWMILQKVNEADNLKGGLSPVVTVRIMKGQECPTLDALSLPCVRVNRYLGYKWSYRLHLLLYTKKSTVDMVFIGNHDLVLPQDEHPHENNKGYFCSIWKFLEQNVIERYQEFGTEANAKQEM